MYSCPCCGKPTFPISPDQAIAFICPECNWENDVFVEDCDQPSDENRGLTLRIAAENYKLYGTIYGKR